MTLEHFALAANLVQRKRGVPIANVGPLPHDLCCLPNQLERFHRAALLCDRLGQHALGLGHAPRRQGFVLLPYFDRPPRQSFGIPKSALLDPNQREVGQSRCQIRGIGPANLFIIASALLEVSAASSRRPAACKANPSTEVAYARLIAHGPSIRP